MDFVFHFVMTLLAEGSSLSEILRYYSQAAHSYFLIIHFRWIG